MAGSGRDQTFDTPQHVDAWPNGLIAVGCDKGPLRLLDCETGETVDTIAGVARAIAGGDGALVLCVQRGRRRISLRRQGSVDQLWSVQLESFAVLDMLLTSEEVVMSEAGAGVRCFSLDGSERWRFDGPEGHATALAFDVAARRFRAVLAVFEEDQESSAPVSFDRNGELETAVTIRAAALGGFIAGGTLFVAMDGSILSAEDGAELWRLGQVRDATE